MRVYLLNVPRADLVYILCMRRAGFRRRANALEVRSVNGFGFGFGLVILENPGIDPKMKGVAWIRCSLHINCQTWHALFACQVRHPNYREREREREREKQQTGEPNFLGHSLPGRADVRYYIYVRKLYIRVTHTRVYLPVPTASKKSLVLHAPYSVGTRLKENSEVAAM